MCSPRVRAACASGTHAGTPCSLAVSCPELLDGSAPVPVTSPFPAAVQQVSLATPRAKPVRVKVGARYALRHRPMANCGPSMPAAERLRGPGRAWVARSGSTGLAALDRGDIVAPVLPWEPYAPPAPCASPSRCRADRCRPATRAGWHRAIPNPRAVGQRAAATRRHPESSVPLRGVRTKRWRSFVCW